MLPNRPTAFKPSVRTFSPDDPPPSRRRATRDVLTSLREASAWRMRYRLRIKWRDVTAPSGVREEIIFLSSPTSLLRLIKKIEATPHRPIRSIRVEAIARAFWSEVPLDYVRWRSAQKERLDLEQGVATARAAKRGGRG